MAVESRVSEDIGLVSSFVNTLEKNVTRPDEEKFDLPETLQSWLSEQGIPPGDDLNPDDLKKAIEFREAMRLLLLANNAGELDRAALRRLREAADEGLIRVEIHDDGQAYARPANEGVPALFA